MGDIYNQARHVIEFEWVETELEEQVEFAATHIGHYLKSHKQVSYLFPHVSATPL